MKYLILSIAYILIFYSSKALIAQDLNSTDINSIKKNAPIAHNVNAASNDNEVSVDAKIIEVYGQQFMDNNPELFPIFRNFIHERIEYKTEAQSPDEKYPKLSSFGLRNKNNPSLSRDLSFDNHTFNPLKYNISAFEPLTQIIRFDNSDILIIVKPYNNQNKSN
jgi:hypothetical protein